MSTPAPSIVPRHVAIIMDGNGRWARRGGMLRLRGHEAGVDSVRDVTTAAAEWGIEHLTLYAFSVENWKRPAAEVRGLMRFLKRFLRDELPTLLQNGIRLRGLGRLDDLPDDVLEVLREIEQQTAHGDRMTLRLALSYGGRQEIADAAQELARKAVRGELDPEQIDAAAIARELYDPSMPDPDLVIRSAGELRLSNFLLWEASYAEFWFTEVLWPEFRRAELAAGCEAYAQRVRRFGRVIDNDPAAQAPQSSA
ncbi:MAG: di-trans,poly-cis-decaprenylcistransferase [Planctomycetes bacterium]|nr:di-trans,poly-cis-decaprenylcistransferase [Planctomycetota bacterium]